MNKTWKKRKAHSINGWAFLFVHMLSVATVYLFMVTKADSVVFKKVRNYSAFG